MLGFFITCAVVLVLCFRRKREVEMSKHTPGPWELSSIKGSYRYVDRLDANGAAWYQLASVVVKECGDTSEEGEANALLIAAAPNMLEALEKIVEEDAESAVLGYPQLRPLSLILAKSAIAKAIGKEVSK